MSNLKVIQTDVSIVIPTFKRSTDLKEALESIITQTVSPKEIIIVDSANDLDTKKVVDTFTDSKYNHIVFKYLLNNIDSSAVARNIGASSSLSDIILFLDDDVVLYDTYIETILKTHIDYRDSIIVQGNVVSNKSTVTLKKKIWDSMWNLYYAFFNRVHMTSSSMKVLKSGQSTTPSDPMGVLYCQWASGCNLSIKKKFIENYMFDPNMIKYSYGEDKDLSYRVYKNNPKSVLLISDAKLIHKGSFNKSSPKKKAILMEKTYSLYFVVKNLNKPLNYIFFLWSEIGILLQDILLSILFIRDVKYFVKKLEYDLYADYICIRYFSKIRNLDLEYINENFIL